MRSLLRGSAWLRLLPISWRLGRSGNWLHLPAQPQHPSPAPTTPRFYRGSPVGICTSCLSIAQAKRRAPRPISRIVRRSSFLRSIVCFLTRQSTRTAGAAGYFCVSRHRQFLLRIVQSHALSHIVFRRLGLSMPQTVFHAPLFFRVSIRNTTGLQGSKPASQSSAYRRLTLHSTSLPPVAGLAASGQPVNLIVGRHGRQQRMNRVYRNRLILFRRRQQAHGGFHLPQLGFGV
jgi:hypothetical protein